MMRPFILLNRFTRFTVFSVLVLSILVGLLSITTASYDKSPKADSHYIIGLQVDSINWNNSPPVFKAVLPYYKNTESEKEFTTSIIYCCIDDNRGVLLSQKFHRFNKGAFS